MTALAKPALGQTVKDPEFGTTIRRITAVSTSEGDGAVIMPMYGTIPAWSTDEKYLILWHRNVGHELYDGRTYAYLRKLELESPTDLEQVLWDPLDSDLIYYPSNYNALPRLMRYRVSTGKNELQHYFTECPGTWGALLTLGSDPGYMSWTGQKVVGLGCGDRKIVYSIAKDAVVSSADIPSSGIVHTVAPSGLVSTLWGGVYDYQLKWQRGLAMDNPGDHSCLGYSPASKHDTLNAVVFTPPEGGTEQADVGTIVSFDLHTGERKTIVGEANGYPYPPGGTHISAVALKAPGVVVASVVGLPAGQRVLDQEIVRANTDTGEVCRVAHHRSYAGEGRWGYWAEPHAVISPSGTRILFGSDWGNGTSVDSYVVELQTYQP